MKDLAGKVDPKKIYSWDEAIALVQETSKVKFDASVELHANLGIDPKKGEQQIRATVALPHGTGKSKKVAAFVSAEKEKEAKAVKPISVLLLYISCRISCSQHPGWP